jgi:uroporphyrinogen-III synthase
LKHEYVFQSFIKTVPIPFSLPPSFDWLFFNSANAVAHFFKNVDTSTISCKIACIGESTHTELIKIGKKAHFIGKGSIVEIGVEFAKILGAKIVLIPCSNRSAQSIQQNLPIHQVIQKVIYNTVFCDVTITNIDAVFFTSPSNVMAFNSVNSFPNQVFAIGETTKAALLKKNITSVEANDYQSQTWIEFLESYPLE